MLVVHRLPITPKRLLGSLSWNKEPKCTTSRQSFRHGQGLYTIEDIKYVCKCHFEDVYLVRYGMLRTFIQYFIQCL